MLKSIIIAARATFATLLLTGIAYPFVITGVAQVLFHNRANGSMLPDEKGRIIGSELIAQPFKGPAYFHPRPSAAGDNGYDGTSSSGSNFGTTSKKLKERVTHDAERLSKENPEARAPIPVDLLTASASGLDPHISPEGALWQIARVAKARGVSAVRIHPLVQALIEEPELGFLGDARVNVLLLNLTLDQHFGRPTRTATVTAAGG